MVVSAGELVDEIPCGDGDVIAAWKFGLAPYRAIWSLQKDLQKRRVNAEIGDVVLIGTHPPVITLGTSSKREHVLATDEILRAKNIEVIEIERGGDVTYHSPEQLVVYPIMDLSGKRKDVHWYMRALEECVIRTLRIYEIPSERIQEKTGVWIPQCQPNQNRRKIASFGVRISRWCTMHGASLNVNTCKEGFSLIHPCGFADIEISSLEDEKGKTFALDEVADNLLRQFTEVFEYSTLSPIYGSAQSNNNLNRP